MLGHLFRSSLGIVPQQIKKTGQCKLWQSYGAKRKAPGARNSDSQGFPGEEKTAAGLSAMKKKGAYPSKATSTDTPLACAALPIFVQAFS